MYYIPMIHNTMRLHLAHHKKDMHTHRRSALIQPILIHIHFFLLRPMYDFKLCSLNITQISSIVLHLAHTTRKLERFFYFKGVKCTHWLPKSTRWKNCIFPLMCCVLRELWIWRKSTTAGFYHLLVSKGKLRTKWVKKFTKVHDNHRWTLSFKIWMEAMLWLNASFLCGCLEWMSQLQTGP